MNTISQLARPELFGLFELDGAGTVLYSRIRRNNTLIDAKPALVGRNFFDEVLPFENVGEFHRRFRNFLDSSDSSDNFIFDCRFQKSVKRIKVMLMRISENEGRLKFVIVDIRQLAPALKVKL